MGKKLYVANIERWINDWQLQDLFAQSGEIDNQDSRIITDRETWRSRWFGFISFVNADDADKAIEQFNWYELNGRALFVTEARPKKENN